MYPPPAPQPFMRLISIFEAFEQGAVEEADGRGQGEVENPENERHAQEPPHQRVRDRPAVRGLCGST